MIGRSRRVASVVAMACVVACVVAGLAVGAPASAAPHPAAKRAPVHVGALALRHCDVLPRALCGSILRPWDPGHPAQGKVRVGFAYVPARDRAHPALGTVAPHEGGPGFSTTSSASDYAGMYGPLLKRHNLLLVDQRGTGFSAPLNCRALQDLRIAYRVAAGRCGRSLGAHADDYTTARSADDLAAVISRLGLGKVDVYGDSYGTFFTEVFAGRHRDQVRSIVLDSAYPTYGESAYYPTQGPAMRHAFALACARSTACRTGGRSFRTALRLVLRKVRSHPWRGVSHDADGRRAHVRISGPTLVSVAFGATFSAAFYREMTAALRSGLRGDRKPLLRLVAEAIGGGTYAGAPVDYSEGLDAAVACHDYPQLFNMRARPAVRQHQFDAAIARTTRRQPALYGPFTIREYARSDWQELDWCTRWPVAPADNPARPPKPPGGYPAVPVLVLSGELDSITTPAEGRLVAHQFPDAQQVVVRNSFHVTAIGDTDACAVRLVRAFVLTPGPLSPTQRACAGAVPPLRTMGVFPRGIRSVAPAAAVGVASVRARRVGRIAAMTVVDVVDRWLNNYSGVGFGLRGGRWSFSGDRITRFTLHRDRLVPGVAVSGRATWDRYGNVMHVRLRLGGAGPHGRLHGSWATRRVGAKAVLAGKLGGHRVRLTFAAP